MTGLSAAQENASVARVRLPWPLAATVGATLGAIAFAACARMPAFGPWLAFVGLVPFLAALDRARTGRRALAAGLLLSLVFSGAVFAWFARAIAGYAEVPLAVGFALLLAAAPLFQPQFVPWALARFAARRSGRARAACLGAAVYVATESLATKLLGDTLGQALFPSPTLRQAADLFGTAGLTLAVLLVNEMVLAVVVRLRSGCPGDALRPALAVALLLTVWMAYGTARTARLDAQAAGAETLSVAVVQAGIGQYERLRRELGSYDAVATILDTHLALSLEALAEAPADLLVWPETVYPTTFGQPKSAAGAAFDRVLLGLGQRQPFAFGAYDAEGGREYNAAFLLTPRADGAVELDAYRKRRPFPLIERVPAWLDHPFVRTRLPWLGSWEPGGDAAVFQVPRADGTTARLAPLVCYDALAPSLTADAAAHAHAFLTLSNDSWFDADGGPLLHLVVAAFRSIETRRPQIRATNTGITTTVSITGALGDRLDVGERGVLRAEIPLLPARPTLATRWGEASGPALAGLAGLGLLLSRRRGRGRSTGARRAR